MIDSATSLRDRRMADTARQLRTTARALTIENGLAGFTIEELCEGIGVSRRTFFNYFASKENAVLGIPARTPEDTAPVDRFLAAPGALLTDLIELVIARWELLGLTAEEAPEIGRALEREPRLLGHLLELIGEAERSDVVLVEQREGWATGDPRAVAAVQLLGAMMRSLTEPPFGDPGTYRAALEARLSAIESLFTTHSRRTS